MPRNLLSDRAVRSAKPKEKPYRLSDGDRLFVLVAPTGTKSYQFRYKLNGVPDTLTLKGARSLADARRDVEPLRRMVDAGDDPKIIKRVERAAKAAANAQTFKAIAAAWAKLEQQRKKWSAAYVQEVEQSLRNHLSDLDELPVSTIVARITAPLLHAVEARAPMMQEKVERRLHAIMDYCVEIGALDLNPLPRRRRGKVERKHFPAVTDLNGLGDILRAARAADPCKGITRAHLLLAFTAQRVSEVVSARWDEFDLDAGIWSIPRARMKRKDEQRGPHVIPLPPALLEALRGWNEADGADGLFVCPAPRDPSRPITPEGVEKFYRNALGLGGKHSPHSWRSAFSTVARDAGKDADSIEAQLDHVVGNKVASAYDRAQRLALRRELLTWYEGKLTAARHGATVTGIRGR
jgi:integrase